MRRPAIDQLVYDQMFPRPKASEPSNFSGVLTRYLVFEVREEVHSFYGHLDTQEAKYPGLDYTHPIHRLRLSRWPWHRRLFRAFDALRLTPTEIAQLTKWEGTQWAKERYEKEQNIVIQDTAAEGMPDYRRVENWLDEQPRAVNDRALPSAGSHTSIVYASREGTVDECLAAHTLTTFHTQVAPPRERAVGAAAGHDEDDATGSLGSAGSGRLSDAEEVEMQSIGIQLNQRLRERVAAHNAGDTSQPLDEDWEQWLKAAIETGNLAMVARRMPLEDLPFVHSQYTSQAAQADANANANSSAGPGLASSSSDQGQTERIGAGQISGAIQGENDITYSNIIPSQILHSARQGRWDEVPEFLHEVLRLTIEADTYQEAAASPRDAPFSASSTNTTNTANTA
ncbi:hypothetical protein SCUCBS95973_009634 [Sporothrix curviconia]|uniref:Uncharacterized protein n=1 Tax=Sporothrix curviconia TaxID=1260050 RepID=A0ABP0CWK7_9PEZI